MKTRWLVMAALPALAIPLARAQTQAHRTEPKTEAKANGSHERLTRVLPRSPRAAAQDDSERFDREEWKKKLTANDLQDREDAFGRLVELASRNPEAREALETWSKDDADAGLAWTSRLILRDVGQRPSRWHTAGGPGWGLFGKDLDFDDFAKRFDDLDSMFGDLRTQWDEMLGTLPSPSWNGGQGTQSSESSMSLESGPDGVTCKVTEKVDGEEKTSEYTAKTIDELLEAHPELRPKIGGSGPHFWVHPTTPTPNRMRILNPRGVPGTVHIDPNDSGHDSDLHESVPGNASDPRTDRLGIFCAPVEESAAAELGLESGVGLRVQDTQPGTIARILGLRSGDVVTEINGTTIRSTDDVKEALQDRADGADVSVVVAGVEGHRTLTWKPAAKKPDTRDEKSGKKSGDQPGKKSGEKSGARNL